MLGDVNFMHVFCVIHTLTALLSHKEDRIYFQTYPMLILYSINKNCTNLPKSCKIEHKRTF